MIMPNKYISLDKSVIGVGAIILKKLRNKNAILITDFWIEIYKEDITKSYRYFIIVLMYLYTIKTITYNKEGYIECLKN
jgi:hypothetical protein